MTGPPDVVALKPIRKPEPVAGEVLVRVRARGKIVVHFDQGDVRNSFVVLMQGDST